MKIYIVVVGIDYGPETIEYVTRKSKFAFAFARGHMSNFVIKWEKGILSGKEIERWEAITNYVSVQEWDIV